MATKIEKILQVSGSELYEQRGALVAKALKNAITMKANQINQELFKLDMAEANLMDLGKTDETTLLPNSPADCEELINKLIRLDIQRQELEVESISIQRVIDNYFTEEDS